ncbi:MAG: hypothetical protein ACYDBQ_11185 [Thermoplasmatota archaeon]
MVRLPLVFLVAALVAGCAAPPSPGNPSAHDESRSSHHFTGPLVAVRGAEPQGFVALLNFTVAPATQTLWLNLTVNGTTPDGVDVEYDPPGCGAGACATNATTQGGRSDVAVPHPAQGEWAAKMFAHTAIQYGTYDLKVETIGL